MLVLVFGVSHAAADKWCIFLSQPATGPEPVFQDGYLGGITLWYRIHLRAVFMY